MRSYLDEMPLDDPQAIDAPPQLPQAPAAPRPRAPAPAMPDLAAARPPVPPAPSPVPVAPPVAAVPPAPAPQSPGVTPVPLPPPVMAPPNDGAVAFNGPMVNATAPKNTWTTAIDPQIAARNNAIMRGVGAIGDLHGTQSGAPTSNPNEIGFLNSYSDTANKIRQLGYAMNNEGDILDPLSPPGSPPIGNAGDPNFTLAALAPSSRGRIASNPDDQTQLQFPQPDEAVAGGDMITSSAPGSAPVGAVPAPAGSMITSMVPQGAGTGNGSRTDSPGFGNRPALPATLPGLAPVGVGGGASAPSAGPSGNTPIDPASPLTAQRLQVGPLADRFKLAQERFDAETKRTDPAYQASLRDANRYAAQGGALGSGALNTSIGDLAARRGDAMDSWRSNFLTDALEGTIGDEFARTGIDERQQNFQAGRQDNAFGQGVVLKQLQEALTQGGHNRSLDTLGAGNTGDPSSLWATLSQIFGNQASNAGTAAANGFKTAAAGPPAAPLDWRAILEELMGGGSSAAPPLPGQPGYTRPSVPSVGAYTPPPKPLPGQPGYVKPAVPAVGGF